MKKILFYFLLLLVPTLLVSCGGSSDDDGQPSTPAVNEEEVLKEKIIGVWKDTDQHFISFSKENFYSSYLDEAFVDEGDYTVSKDSVIVRNKFRGLTTKYVIKSVTDSKLVCEAHYTQFNVNGRDYESKDVIRTITFTKSTETPCVKDHNLIGKTWEARYAGGYDGRGRFSQYNIIDFYRDYYTGKGRNDHLTWYYVYLQPNDIYYIQWTDGGLMWEVRHMSISFNQDGQVEVN